MDKSPHAQRISADINLATFTHRGSDGVVGEGGSDASLGSAAHTPSSEVRIKNHRHKHAKDILGNWLRHTGTIT